MKKVCLSLLLLCLVIISFTCEENFSPKTGFVQQYALFCIVNGDTSYQYAVIERSYNVEGLDPSSYDENTFIKDAKVKIRYNDTDFPLKDSTSMINNKEFSFYYTNSLVPDAGKLMEIRAELPNGNILTGNTVTPKANNISFDYENIRSDTYIEQKEGGLFFIWHLSGEDTAGILYLPALKINYYKFENGQSLLRHKEVPVSYFRNGANYLPNFPIVTQGNTLTYEMDAINRAMREISEGDSVKTNYSIIDAELELLLLDDNLAPYYTTIQTFLDGYSVILNQQDFSNINGGYGVFGSFFSRILHLSFSSDFVLSFGYRLAD